MLSLRAYMNTHLLSSNSYSVFLNGSFSNSKEERTKNCIQKIEFSKITHTFKCPTKLIGFRMLPRIMVAAVHTLHLAAMLSCLFDIILKYVLNNAILQRVFKLVLITVPPVEWNSCCFPSWSSDLYRRCSFGWVNCLKEKNRFFTFEKCFSMEIGYCLFVKYSHSSVL